MASENIIVYILAQTINTASDRIITLTNLFPTYTVNVRYIPPTVPIVPSINMTATNQIQAYQFITVLQEAYDTYPNDYILFLFESSITAVGINTLNAVLTQAITENNTNNTNNYWEILYLTHWSTDCDFIDKTQTITGTNIRLGNSMNTLGFQSYLITPIGVQMLLGIIPMYNNNLFPPIIYPIDTQINMAVQNGGMRIWITYPNIFEYDTFFDINEYNTNVYKTWSCLPINTTTTSSGVNFKPLLIAVVIIILAIVLFWALYRIGPTSTGPCKKTKTKK